MRIPLRTLARVLVGFTIGAGLAFAFAFVFPHRRARRDAGLPLPASGLVLPMAATAQ
jgi:ABC-type nitrate/sulfonate/bicarbonate transport system permease component